MNIYHTELKDWTSRMSEAPDVVKESLEEIYTDIYRAAHASVMRIIHNYSANTNYDGYVGVTLLSQVTPARLNVAYIYTFFS